MSKDWSHVQALYKPYSVFQHRMNHLLLAITLLCFSISIVSAGTPPSRSDKATPIFDGKTLEGWEAPAPLLWAVKDGCLTGGDGNKIPYNDFLCTKASYSNFILHLKIKLTGDPKTGFINSGIQIRTQRNTTGHEVCGYQCDYGEPSWYGGIYDEGRRNRFIAPADMAVLHPAIKLWDWNDYVIKADGKRIQTWINGVQGVDYEEKDADIASDGLIGIQVHGGGNTMVQVKDVFIEELPPIPDAITWEKLGGVEGQRAKLKPQASNPKPQAAASKLTDITSIKPFGADGKPLNLDFEKGTLEGWKVEGNAWEGQPVKGDAVALRKRGQSNHAGEFWIGGYEKMGDKGTGRLTSSSFEVTHPWASFLVGGGKDPKLTRVDVIEEATDKVIHSASGTDLENMRREIVDLRAYTGKRIFVRLIDEGTSGWGHVNFDDFVFHDKKPVVTMVATKANPSDRAARQKESPVLKHLVQNPAKPTAVANAAAQSVVASMMLTPGFQAELIVAEPEVRQPIAFAMDGRGRLWVAEAYSYPNKQPEGKGRDRITIFEDVTGDGTFKKRTVFIEGLNLVSGLEVGFGGVWVGAAPQLLFIPKDQNDKPGEPQVLLDGWGYQDTHETLNSFCWGPDGWLYGNQGVFTKSLVGKPGTPDEQRVPLHSGVWRYHPVRHEFEMFAHGGSNQWGLDFNEAGHLFMTHCRSFWGGGGTTHVIRNGHFWNQANANYAPFISNAGPDFAPDLKNFLPASARYDSGEGGAGAPGTTAIYGGHSHVGTMIYLGDNWPDDYRNHLFTHNLHGHQMNHQINECRGSGYDTVHAGFDLMFAPDPHYIAVDLQTGPDGAVYVIDWCDTQHCHTPAEEAWDRTNGRIYRISWAQTYHPVKVNLGAMSDVELAQLQTHHNDWYSRMARQLLQERATTRKIDAPAIDSLTQLTTSPNYAHVLRGLWALHVIGALDKAKLTAALKNPDERVRAWAIQLGTEHMPVISGEILAQLAAHDSSPTVRLALASAMPVLSAETCWNVGTALAMHSEDVTDRFLPKMIWFGLANVISKNFSRGLELANKTPLPSLANSIRWWAATQSQGRDIFVASISKDTDDLARRELQILAFGLKNEASATAPKAWPEVQTRFAGAATDELAAIFGDKTIISKMRASLANDQAPMNERSTAFNLLKRIGDAEATPIFAKLLDVDQFRSAVIPLLARSNDPTTATALIRHFPKLSDPDRTATLNTLTSRPELAMPLLRAQQDGTFDKKQFGSFQVRQMRNLHNADIDKLLDQTWGKVTESSAGMKATIVRLQKAYQEAPLWAYDAGAGKQTFTQICSVCHTMNGAGGKLGPDLTGSWRNGLAYFLENIVDPNAVVGEQFQLNMIAKRDGSVLSGIMEQETDTALTVRTIIESVIIPKSDIKERQKLAQSLMPPGVLEALSERQTIELLKFLTNKN